MCARQPRQESPNENLPAPAAVKARQTTNRVSSNPAPPLKGSGGQGQSMPKIRRALPARMCSRSTSLISRVLTMATCSSTMCFR